MGRRSLVWYFLMNKARIFAAQSNPELAQEVSGMLNMPLGKHGKILFRVENSM